MTLAHLIRGFCTGWCRGVMDVAAPTSRVFTQESQEWPNGVGIKKEHKMKNILYQLQSLYNHDIQVSKITIIIKS